MLDNFQIELGEINRLQHLFVQKVLTDIWKQDLDEWSRDISMYWMINLNDMFFSFDDFIMIAKYEIDYETSMEWYDMKSLTYQTKRIKEAVKKDKYLKNCNIYMFARYFDNKNLW